MLRRLERSPTGINSMEENSCIVSCWLDRKEDSWIIDVTNKQRLKNITQQR